MCFPYNDKYWMNTANFVQSHIEDKERIFAPAEFEQKFPGRINSYGSTFKEDAIFQWAIIHKGMLDKVGYATLNFITRHYTPVFANEVFVVFSTRQGLPEVDPKSPHIKSLWERMKTHKIVVDTIKGWIINIVLRNKEAIKRIPLLGSIGKRTYHWMQLSEVGDKLSSGRDMIYLGDYRALTRTKFGQKIFVDTRDLSLAPHILLDGYWEMWITKFLKEILQERMTMVEVGSNIGYYTLLAASIIGERGRLYAFEANPEVFDILYQNIIINGFLDRTTLINKAVADKSQKLKFHKLKRCHGGSSIVKFNEEFLRQYRDEIETIEIDAVSLDDYFSNKNMKVDVIKMDAEGAEALIFNGMRNLLEKNQDVKIVCEFTPAMMAATGIDPRQFLVKIADYGFKIRIINISSIAEDVSINKLLEFPHCELFLSKI